MIPLPEPAEILADADAVAEAAAERLVALCRSAPRPEIAVCLSGGSTPKRLYARLGAAYRADLPWDRLHWFFGDDRMVPWTDAASNVHMAREAFGDAPIPEGHLHGIDTGGTLEAGARRYAETLKRFYGADDLDPARPLFDLVLLGLGEDGHTASLFPGKPAVRERGAWVAPVPEAGLAPFVPRITLTIPALASAREALFLVTGAGKQEPLRRLARGEDLPVRHVRSVGRLVWLVDREAAGA